MDTTGKHGSHLYDVNCQICLRKNQEEAVMQIKMEKQRQKEKVEMNTVLRNIFIYIIYA